MHHITVAVGGRVWHGYAVVGQVFHQPQVERQLLHAQPFEQRQHKGGLVGGDEVVGVLDAARATRHSLEGSQLKALQEFAGLI